MARYRFDVDKCKHHQANGKIATTVIESVSVHISAQNMDLAWERFDKQFPIDDEAAIKNKEIYFFNCVTDNVQKEKKDVKQGTKKPSNKTAKQTKSRSNANKK